MGILTIDNAYCGAITSSTTTTTTTIAEYSEAYSGAVYYFSTDGSDSNDGLSKSAPKQTLSAASALTLSAGDAVLFKSSDSFEGTLSVKSGSVGSVITYGAYGFVDSKPSIYGSQIVTGWTSTFAKSDSGHLASCSFILSTYTSFT